MSSLSEDEKKFFMESMGKAMGDPLREMLPQLKKQSDENKKEYIERLTRIETKLDVLITLQRDLQ